ncbi:hypothetical protein HWQ46_15870 [Shewanella sp. D64]|uniref:hypothetical protein n=1 Tax=unclassified Shewanella TaxID=196818 RepID=UPI0022BA61F9|nr:MULTISPECIES: hypothetical protein [unclassified Shewanella]MEC4727025.1 hypothetical protein [Shewanella sp. D64]MEC4737764.1 hypothetical protein [Shewanella sp. E94]WBJ93976.1 hypothetical protein HWQ47_18885 [Shewanella sp. MTB7]
MVLANCTFRALFATKGGDILSRALAAIFGGYILAATACGLLAISLPLPTAESVLVAMMLSFVFYLAAALWSFSVKKSWQAWRDILCISTLFYLLILVVD